MKALLATSKTGCKLKIHEQNLHRKTISTQTEEIALLDKSAQVNSESMHYDKHSKVDVEPIESVVEKVVEVFILLSSSSFPNLGVQYPLTQD